MEGDIALIVRAVRSVSQGLMRDYHELENLQNSTKSTANFCNKSCERILFRLQENLSKYFSNIIFSADDIKEKEFGEKTVLVEIMDGYENFSRSLPYFAIMITILAKKDGRIFADKSVINFPATGEMIRVEKGQGVMFERYDSNIGTLKLRTSQVSEIKNTIASFDKINLNFAKNFSNYRFYNSGLYALYQLLAGKLDVVITRVNYLTLEGIKLFLDEAGGKILLKGDRIIASNLPLSQKTESFDL